MGGVPADQQIKTLVYLSDGNMVLVLIQGDQELNKAKLQSLLGVATLRQASPDQWSAHPQALLSVLAHGD